MVQRRLRGAQLGAATLVIVCGSFAGFAFGHALGQRGGAHGAHAPGRVTSIKGLLGQAILSLPAQKSTAAPLPAAQPAAAPRAVAAQSSKRHGSGGHGKGGGDGGHHHDGPNSPDNAQHGGGNSQGDGR